MRKKELIKRIKELEEKVEFLQDEYYEKKVQTEIDRIIKKYNLKEINYFHYENYRSEYEKYYDVKFILKNDECLVTHDTDVETLEGLYNYLRWENFEIELKAFLHDNVCNKKVGRPKKGKK